MNTNKDLTDLIKYNPGKRLPYSFRIYVGTNPANGNAIHRQRSFRTKDEAIIGLVTAQKKIKNGEPLSKPKHYKFQECYEKWLTIYEKKVKASTLATTKRIFVNHILGEFGSKYIDKIDVPFCQKIVNEWFRNFPKIFKRYVYYASAVFDYALHLGQVQSNPFANIIVPKYRPDSKTNDMKFYSKSELKRFLECCLKSGRYKVYAYFYVLAYSGLRRGEAFALRWSDIDFKNHTLTVNQTISNGEKNKVLIQSPKTLDSIRTIDIDETLIQVLKSWQQLQKLELHKLGLQKRKNNQLVFSNSKNEAFTPQKADAWDRQIADKYHLRYINVHGFRHTHASLLFAAGVDMKDVQQRLGHADIQTTMNIYVHSTKQQAKESADKFATFMRQ